MIPFLVSLWWYLTRRCPEDGSKLERWPEPQTFADWELRCPNCKYRRSI